MSATYVYVRWLNDVTNDDMASVGGKNASLGEMIRSLEEEGCACPARGSRG